LLALKQAPYYTASGEAIYGAKTEIITSKKPFADQFKDNVNKKYWLNFINSYF
jgi:hypothetical protein